MRTKRQRGKKLRLYCRSFNHQHNSFLLFDGLNFFALFSTFKILQHWSASDPMQHWQSPDAAVAKSLAYYLWCEKYACARTSALRACNAPAQAGAPLCVLTRLPPMRVCQSPRAEGCASASSGSLKLNISQTSGAVT